MTMHENAPALTFTGERYTPECPREMLYEHYARYAFARRFVKDKIVLDCACGEGYGSALMAELASEVIGIDLASYAIAHARARYPFANLRFECGDATALSLADQSVDVITSFETLEHLAAHDQMLREFKRVLRPNGVLIISSPDKHTYSDVSGYRNEFHVKELYRAELEALLHRHFKHHRLFGQKLMFQSVIWDMASPSGGVVRADQITAQGNVNSEADNAPLYFLAFCTDDTNVFEQSASLWHLFADQAQSLYQHYQAEIRNGIFGAGLIAQLRAEITALKAQLET
jgi:SAM-dependent methyltransferase